MDTYTMRSRTRGRARLAVALVAMTSLGAVALGGALRLMPWQAAERAADSGHGPQNGWIAYTVALGEWNTPGGPTWESPGGPTRIALEREGASAPEEASARYVGGAEPPQQGASIEQWLSVRQQCPSFSPDGSRLAYVERPPDEGPSGPDHHRQTLVIVPVDRIGQGTDAETRLPGGSLHPCPAWSPDSRRIAFVAGQFIRILGLDGSNQLLETPVEGSITALAWSPGGAAIAFIESGFPNGFNNEGKLRLLPLGGGQPPAIFDEHVPLGSTISWSPDGRRIAITTSATPEPTPDPTGGLPFHQPEWTVVVVPVAGDEPLREIGRGLAPAWSPNGDRIAYQTNPSDEPGSIVVVHLSTGDEDVVPPAHIAPGTALSAYNHDGGSGVWFPHPPQWSPDGNSLLFIGSDGTWGTSVLLKASADGNHAPVLVSETWVAEWYSDQPTSWQLDAR